MKNIYMFQPNYLYGKDAYLPYAIGVLVAYAWKDPEMAKNYEVKDLGFLRLPINTVVDSMENPFLCAFSCYTWNFEYDKALAAAIKKAYPECIIVFGGHEIAYFQSVKHLNQDNYYGCEDIADIFIYDEGEIPFKNILTTLNKGDDLSRVCNISFKSKNGQWITTDREILLETEMPSPYLEGVFDKLISDNRYSFTPTLETNRGCPFSCAYCDWGIYQAKIRKFPMERIKAEIDWFSDHKIDLLFGADSNFGIFERDEEIIDYMISKKKETGYPKKFRVSYTKNTSERVVDINRKLNESGMCKGATLSFQSLYQPTLDAIGRKNVETSFFSKLMSKYNKENIPTYSEIIMGLPEETYESFCNGLDELIISGQHTSINIYICELLPNSAMAQPEYMDKYQIRTAETILNQYHCILTEDITEHSTVIVGTATLPFAEWKRSYLYSLMIQCFHCLGLTRYIAMYLYYEKNIAYKEFYNTFLQWILETPDSVAGQAISSAMSILDSFLKGLAPLGIVEPEFGEILWPLDEACYLKCVCQLEKFFTEFERMCYKEYSNDLKNEMGADLFTYQKNIICKPFDEQRKMNLQYDFNQYFKQIMAGEYQTLEKKECQYMTRVDKAYTDWKSFATEIVWWGRKGGKNYYSLEEV